MKYIRPEAEVILFQPAAIILNSDQLPDTPELFKLTGKKDVLPNFFE
ncbi:MAG: hypothetical protein IJA60_07435 [Clostridia bacterium]|nr:hypothetical protein [Clostridia bacterium]